MNLMDPALLTDLLSGMSLVAIATAIVLAILLVAIPLRRDRGALTIVSWPALGLAQLLIGHAILDQVFFDDAFWPAFAASSAAFIVGYWATSARPRDVVPAAPPPPDLVRERVAQAFALVITAFVTYHFVVGGIPLLSPDVELERFNFTSSGLFGIPGRMFLFGLPFAVVYVSHVAVHAPSPAVLRLRTFMWCEYVVAMILSGFKGSLVLVVLQWLLVRSMSGTPVRLRALLRPRYVAVVAGAVLFGGVMAQRYDTLEVSSTSDTATYFAERATVIAASAGAIAVRGDYAAHPGLYVVDDTLYILQKYSGIQLTDRELFPLDKVISSQLTGTPLEEDEFNVPVTVGGFASLVVDFGVPLAIALMLGFGALFGHLRERAERTDDPFAFASLGLMIQMIYAFVVNGNLAYCAINTLVMLALLGIVHALCARAAATRGGDLEDRAGLGEPV